MKGHKTKPQSSLKIYAGLVEAWTKDISYFIGFLNGFDSKRLIVELFKISLHLCEEHAL